MNIFKTASKIFSNLFNDTTETTETKSFFADELESKAFGGYPFFGTSNFPYNSTSQQGTMRVPDLNLINAMFNDTVYTCMRRTSDAMVEVPFNLKGKRKTLNTEPVTLRRDHPLIFLLENPNPDMNWNQFITVINMYSELCGDAYIKKDFNSTLGTPIALWPLETFKVTQQFNENGDLIGYKYMKGIAEVEFSVEEVIHIKAYPDPLMPYHKGFSVVQGAWQEIQLGLREITMMNAQLENNATPSFIVQPQMPVGAVQAERLEKSLRQKFKEGGPWVPPHHMEVESLTPPQDTQQIEFYNLVRKITCTGMGVPLGILEPESESYASAFQAYKNFIDLNVLPKLNVIIMALSKDLCPYFDEKIYLELDVNDMARNEEMDMKKWDMLCKYNVVTRNNVLEWAGEKLIDGPEGDEFVKETIEKDEVIDKEDKETKKSITSMWEDMKLKSVIDDITEKAKPALVSNNIRPDTTHERRIIHPVRTKHCLPCLELAEVGWVAVGTLPPIGSTVCGKNCKCTILYKSDKRYTRNKPQVDEEYKEELEQLHTYKPKKKPKKRKPKKSLEDLAIRVAEIVGKMPGIKANVPIGSSNEQPMHNQTTDETKPDLGCSC